MCPPPDRPLQYHAQLNFRGLRGLGRGIVTKLRAQLENGVFLLRELSQASVLSRAMDNVFKDADADADAASLEDLSVLSSSAVFAGVWQTAGAIVLRELNGEPADQALLLPVESINSVRGSNTIDSPEQVPGDDDELGGFGEILDGGEEDYEDDAGTNARDEEATEDWQVDGDVASPPATLDGDTWEGDPAEVASLSLDNVITRVVPLALARWGDLVDRISSGKIDVKEAWVIFPGSDCHREEQVRQVFAWLAGRRSGIQAASQTAESGAARFLDALEAHASIKWFLDAAPKLLDAQVVLYSASTLEERLAVGAGAADPGATASTGDASQGDRSVADSGSVSSAIFATPLDEDASRTALEGILQTLQMRWTHISIGEASTAWSDAGDWGRPVFSRSNRRQRGLGEENHGVLGCCRLHVDLLSVLSAAPDLVDWLVKVYMYAVANEDCWIAFCNCRTARYDRYDATSIVAMGERGLNNGFTRCRGNFYS